MSSVYIYLYDMLCSLIGNIVPIIQFSMQIYKYVASCPLSFISIFTLCTIRQTFSSIRLDFPLHCCVFFVSYVRVSHVDNVYQHHRRWKAIGIKIDYGKWIRIHVCLRRQLSLFSAPFVLIVLGRWTFSYHNIFITQSNKKFMMGFCEQIQLRVFEQNRFLRSKHIIFYVFGGVKNEFDIKNYN